MVSVSDEKFSIGRCKAKEELKVLVALENEEEEFEITEEMEIAEAVMEMQAIEVEARGHRTVAKFSGGIFFSGHH